MQSLSLVPAAAKIASPPSRPRVALIVDPRFPGGTSSAVAAEVRALAGFVDLEVFALETAMFKGREVNPRLEAALEAQGIEPIWNPAVVHADTIVFHNPACLKFDARLAPRLSCRNAFVVTHENFLRPGGAEGFDVGGCLRLIEARLVCSEAFLAPVSAWNRRGVASWLAERGGSWRIADIDWFNICDFEMMAPTATPRDRRGRHSRPGLEKFPPRAALEAQFPAHAEHCAILGADSLLLDPDPPPKHWSLRRFGETPVARFLEQIDFFVYFTHPLWRESFGRAIAEAIAAGKVVITDPGTAESFGAAVIASDGTDIDAIIARLIAEPKRYTAFVRAAQASLARFRPEVFARQVLAATRPGEGQSHALL